MGWYATIPNRSVSIARRNAVSASKLPRSPARRCPPHSFPLQGNETRCDRPRTRRFKKVQHAARTDLGTYGEFFNPFITLAALAIAYITFVQARQDKTFDDLLTRDAALDAALIDAVSTACLETVANLRYPLEKLQERGRASTADRVQATRLLDLRLTHTLALILQVKKKRPHSS